MEASEAPKDVKERLKASYDAMAPEYNKWTERHTPLRLAKLEQLYARLPDLTAADMPVTVLELGCGSGVPVLQTLLQRNPSLRAIANDLSDTQISLARENLAPLGGNDRVRFVSGDMAQLSVEEGSLTAVVALYSLIHLQRDEQREMVRRVAGWLRPGGRFLATFHAVDMPGAIMESWLHERGWMFWSGYGPDETVKGVEEAGLTVESRDIEGDEEEAFMWLIARK
ncbi:Demethylrebeccamycin-D-glucose O-methyltransferase-like protein [Paramyrothecium foliicola]|nr:Demethylrebeccamycin-D-glucose O-methyltransferase-like protein [Paramyrothecium foliicola]